MTSFQKSAEERRGCAAAAALWLSAYMAFRNAAKDTFACARARVARLRGRDVFRSEKVRASQALEPFGSSQSPRARPAPHESLDVFAAASARDREIVQGESDKFQKLVELKCSSASSVLELAERRRALIRRAVALLPVARAHPPHFLSARARVRSQIDRRVRGLAHRMTPPDGACR